MNLLIKKPKEKSVTVKTTDNSKSVLEMDDFELYEKDQFQNMNRGFKDDEIQRPYPPMETIYGRVSS
jgi:hypothetical protein